MITFASSCVHSRKHERSLHHLSGKKPGLDVMQSHPWCRTRFAQYHATSAMLGWPGDGNCYLLHKLQSSGSSHLLLDDVSRIFGHLCEAHIRELEACLHARWGREECALNWYHFTTHFKYNYTCVDYCHWYWNPSIGILLTDRNLHIRQSRVENFC